MNPLKFPKEQFSREEVIRFREREFKFPLAWDLKITLSSYFLTFRKKKFERCYLNGKE